MDLLTYEEQKEATKGWNYSMGYDSISKAQRDKDFEWVLTLLKQKKDSPIVPMDYMYIIDSLIGDLKRGRVS